MILLVIVTSFEMNENLKQILQNQSDSIKRIVLLGIVFLTIGKAKWNQKTANFIFLLMVKYFFTKKCIFFLSNCNPKLWFEFSQIDANVDVKLAPFQANIPFS